MGRKSKSKKRWPADFRYPERSVQTAFAAANAPSASGEPASLKKWLFATALIAAIFLAYYPAWHGGFIWDDDTHLLDNPVLKTGGVARAWIPGNFRINYWPLTFMVYRLEFETWGLEPLGFHLVNIALHAVSALLVWRVLVELNVPGAMVAAAIFALHPVNVESVAWITQLKGLLSLLFALVSTLFYLRYDRLRAPSLALQASFASRNDTNLRRAQMEGQGNIDRTHIASRNDASLKRKQRNGWLLYAAAIAAFGLSTLAKVMMITLPVVLLACVWWRRGSIERRDLVRMVPYLLIGAFMTGLEFWSQQRVQAGDDVRADSSVLGRAAVAGWAVWFYLGKLLWPLDLRVFYPRWKIDEESLLSYLPGLLLAILFAVALWRRRSWGRPVVMLLVGYVGLLLPVLGFANIYFMRYSLVADHWQYAATIVPCAMLTAAAAWVARGGWMASRERKRPEAADAASGRLRSRLATHPLSWVLALTLLAGLAYQTWRQSHLYTDIDTLWNVTLAKDPNCWMAHNNFGMVLAGRGQLDEAIDHYHKAIEIKPDHVGAYVNLGRVSAGRGQVDEAIDYYRKALDIKPDFAEAHNQLGLALAGRGQYDEAIDHYRKAVEIKPDFALAHNNLGLALAGRGQFDEAVLQYRTALEIMPDFVDAHINIGAALADRGLIDDAIAEYQKALVVKPRSASAHFNLALAMGDRNQIDQAIDHYRKALDIDPDLDRAHNNLGKALTDRKQVDEAAYREQVDEAIAHYRKALAIKPDYLEAHVNLGSALAGRRQFDEAINHYRKALEIKPDSIEAHYNLGSALLDRGEVAEANQHYGKALDLATAQNNWALANKIRAQMRPAGRGD